jgi:energy-coupling factor transporter ATP-binding protein EcfA2
MICEPVSPDHYYKVSIGVDWYQTYKDDQLLNNYLYDMCTPSVDSGLSVDEMTELTDWRLDCILYFCGAMILRKECFALGIIGEPGRGKGTLLKLIESLIPDKSVKSYISLHRLEDNSYLEALCRSSLNVEYDEVTKCSVSAKSTAELKKIVLGEPCQVRKLYANTYNIEPRVAMCLAANKEPKFETEDEAIFDRFIFLDVGENIGNKRTNGEGNPNLGRDLTLPKRRQTFAIMAVQKWIEITSKGIDLRASSWAKKARQKSAMNSTGATQFLAEHYRQSEGAVVSLAEVYSHFTSVTPVTYQVTIKSFAEKLKGLGVRVDKYTSRKSEYANLRGRPCIFGWSKNTESYDSLGSEIMTALSTMN